MKTTQNKAEKRTKSSYRGLRSSLLFVSLLISLTVSLKSQIVKNPLSGNGNFRYSVALSMAQLPRTVVGEEIAQVPMLELSSSMEMSESSGLTLKLAGCYLSNYASLEYSYKMKSENFIVTLSDESRVWFGVATMSGFDASAYGMQNSPELELSTMVKGFRAALALGANLEMFSKANFGTAYLENKSNKLKGVSAALNLQQPLTENVHLTFEAKLNYTEPSYHLWLAFSEKNTKFFMPEFKVGFNF